MRAIRRARQESLDFQPTELDVFELAANYVFYYLETDESPILGRKPKRYYTDILKQFIRLGSTIRVGSSRLSALVERAELSAKRKVELAELVKQLEATDES